MYSSRSKWAVCLALLLAMSPVASRADDDPDQPVRFRQRDLSGPRLGFTWLDAKGSLQEELDSKNIGQLVSQFGWHFERQIVPEGGGPQFILEAIPLVAGVEYGKLIPSLTLGMGVRWPGGIEFGIGPNGLYSGGDEPFKSALVIAVGKSFDYGGVSLPLNLAVATGHEGQRYSLIIGYAIQRSSSMRSGS